MRKFSGVIGLVVPLVLFLVIPALVFVGCPKSGLVPPEGGELTEADVALDTYYQALKWNNNCVANVIANIRLLPADQQKAWVQRFDPIKTGMDATLAGWKLKLDSGDYDTLDQNRAEFKRLKNEMLDVLFDVGKLFG